MNFRENFVAKVGTLFIAVAMVMTFSAVPVEAQTNAELEAQIQSLLATIAALQAQISGGTQTHAGTCPSGVFLQTDLAIGAQGPAVQALQVFLNMSADTQVAVTGPGSPGHESMYFGPLTRAAVIKFQEKHRAQVLTPVGLVNGSGYWGPSSRAHAQVICSTVVPPADDDDDDDDDSDSDDLQGGAGSVDTYQLISSLSNEEVGEGQNDVEVAGLEIEVSESSDLMFTAVRLDFDQGTADRSFNRYADEVSVWLDGEEIARVDADTFTRSNNYTRTLTLDSGAIVRSDNTGELVVAVSGLSNLDSADEGETWTVDFASVRFMDAMGVTISENPGTAAQTFSFESFAAASDLEVRLLAGDTSINNARTIEVSSTSNTNDEDVFSFGVRVEGGDEVYVDEIVVSATTTGALLGKVISAAHLYLDGSSVGSESIADGSSATSITFDDLDLDLADGTHDFVVAVDFRKADGTNYSTGATIDMDISTTNRDAWYMEDENGNLVAASDRKGSVSGDAHTLRTQGLALEMTSSSVTSQNNATTPSSSYGEFRMTVEVTAIGETLYVPQTVARGASSTVGAAFQMEDSNGSAYTAGTTTQSFVRKSGGTIDGSRVRIDEGQTAVFELYVTLDPAAAGQYRAQLLTVGFNDTNATPDDTVSATPANDYETALLQITN